MNQDRGENLKMKLKSLTKLKLCKTREELALRNTERNLSEELRSTRMEIEMTTQQLEIAITSGYTKMPSQDERLLVHFSKGVQGRHFRRTDLLNDLKQEVSKIKYQIAMIGICEASEKSKINNHIANVLQHQNDFDTLFSKESEAMEIHKLEIKKKEEQEKELEQQKKKIMEEKNQLLQQKVKAIEDECETIEQECAVLMNRNKAIMLKLRRKLIESEDTRRALMKGGETLEPKH